MTSLTCLMSIKKNIRYDIKLDISKIFIYNNFEIIYKIWKKELTSYATNDKML